MGLTNLYFICGQIVLLTWLAHTHTGTHSNRQTHIHRQAYRGTHRHAQPHSRPAITLSLLAAVSFSRETERKGGKEGDVDRELKRAGI